MTHTHHGKWSQTGVPKKGWSCVGFDDLEEPSQLCEMCESIEVRYVHYMHHAEYPDTLAVGCVCAENMEQDYVRPRERETRMRSLSQRRKAWGRRKWKTSHRGNAYLNAEGYNLVLSHTVRGWQVIVKNRETERQQAGHKFYQTDGAAKDAALMALLWAKENL